MPLANKQIIKKGADHKQKQSFGDIFQNIYFKISQNLQKSTSVGVYFSL